MSVTFNGKRSGKVFARNQRAIRKNTSLIINAIRTFWKGYFHLAPVLARVSQMLAKSYVTLGVSYWGSEVRLLVLDVPKTKLIAYLLSTWMYQVFELLHRRSLKPRVSGPLFSKFGVQTSLLVTKRMQASNTSPQKVSSLESEDRLQNVSKNLPLKFVNPANLQFFLSSFFSTTLDIECSNSDFKIEKLIDPNYHRWNRKSNFCLLS